MSDFTAKMHQKTFGGRALPDPVGELKRSPHPLAVKRGLFLTEGRGGRGRQGRERDGREGWDGKRGVRTRVGMEGKEGREGEGKGKEEGGEGSRMKQN